jgi:integrase
MSCTHSPTAGTSITLAALRGSSARLDEWKALIEEAGLPERRLHDARHTAATVLAILVVPTPTAMAIMGWSSAEMAPRYQHVLDSIRKGVAD